ncbi:MAG: phosphodiester glycosidase family protein [Firmicutes bacterium]|nr:phosphodiester glycosidase family protein [Bacillota bacterium]
MKRRTVMRRVAAAALAAVMALGPVSSFAATFGTQLEQKNLDMTETIRLTNESWYSTYLDDEIVENYVTYEPDGDVVPVVHYGNDIYGAAGMRTVIGYAQEAGLNVIAAINGDFFTMDNGVATGLVIKEGIIRSSESTVANYNSVGFYDDGEVIIGRSGLQTRAHYTNTSGTAITLGMHLNKQLTKESGIVLYTEDYNDSNKATVPSFNVVLNVTDGEPRINETMTGVVAALGGSTTATPIREGEVVISMASNTPYVTTLQQMMTLSVGDEVEFTFEADEDWEDVEYAVGAGYKLLTDGVNVAPITDKTRAPRTALGITDDGEVIFYTVDGRQKGYSQGTYQSELADRLKELGCVEAVNLDGGGSTGLRVLYPGDENTSLVNQPSGGSMRACANYILLVTDRPSRGGAEALHLYPYSVTMLAGAQQEFTVKATDQAYYAAEIPGRISFDVDNHRLGSFGEDGNDDNVFTAGNRDMSGKVEVYGGGASGTAEVTVVESPTSIQLTNANGTALGSVIAIGAGETYDFGAKAIYKRKTIVSQDDCYTWEVSGNIGTIDEFGVFTADPNAEENGTITVSAGDTSTTITVNVAGRGVRLEDFEGDDFIVEGGDFVAYTNQELAYVHNGHQSLALAYAYETTTDAALTLSAPVAAEFDSAPGTAMFWLYGDESGNEISLTVDAEEGLETISGGDIDFRGWKQIVLDLPEGTTELISLDLTRNGALSGTIYLDHLMVTYGRYLDHTAPNASLSLNGAQLSGYVSDNLDTELTKENLKLTMDGTPISYSFHNGTLTANLDLSDSKTHRVALVVTDASGNIARTALTVPAAATEVAEDGTVLATGDGTPFADTVNHWSNIFDVYLYNRNIASGTLKGEQLYFQPDTNITRLEFAIIVVKWLGLDLNEYADVKTNFADQAQIPAWAESYVKAAYGSGMISGSLSSNGKLYFNPNKNLTRQEAMVVIGKTQPRGYAEADLSHFKDADQVAFWAEPYVKPLVEQKVISGSNGSLLPTSYLTKAQIASIIFNLN